MYASGAVICRALQKLSTPRRLCCATAGADLADGCPDHRGRDVVEGVLTPWAGGPVDGVLQGARDGAVVFRGDEQHGVGAVDRCLERVCLGRVVRVVVLAVQRQVPDGYLGELEVLR